jgi:aryl-alcohol dehydrogenase-like predicted oxidoreductase
MSYGDATTPGAHRWALDDEAAQPFFRQGVDARITFWDTSNNYHAGTSEILVGRAIKRYTRREDVVLATKVRGKMHDGPGGQGLSRRAILEQVDASLARLGTDWIDLYEIHRFDPDTPAEETMEALHDVVKAGKVRYLGASSMYARPDGDVRRHGRRACVLLPHGKGHLARPWGEQSHRSTVDAVVQAFDSPRDEPVVNATQQIAEARGATMAQVALAWVLCHPAASAPMVGATKPHHLDEAVAALDLRLTDDEISALEAPYAGQGPSWF